MEFVDNYKNHKFVETNTGVIHRWSEEYSGDAQLTSHVCCSLKSWGVVFQLRHVGPRYLGTLQI